MNILGYLLLLECDFARVKMTENLQETESRMNVLT